MSRLHLIDKGAKRVIRFDTEKQYADFVAHRGSEPSVVVGPQGLPGDKGPEGGPYPAFSYLIDAPGGFVSKVDGKIPASALPDEWLNPASDGAAPGVGKTYRVLVTRVGTQNGSNVLVAFNRVDYDPHGFVDPTKPVGELYVPESIGNCWVRMTCYFESNAINSSRTATFLQGPNIVPGTRKLLAANTGRGAHMISPWLRSSPGERLGVLYSSTLTLTSGVPWLQLEVRKRT